MSTFEYNALIYDISEKIEEANLGFLKFVCRDHLGNGPCAHITTVRELLLELEKKNLFGIDRLDLLKEILTQLKKQKRSLLKKVDDFEVQRKAKSIGVISRLNRAADTLLGGVKLVCNFKTLGVSLLGVTVALVLRSCTTLEQFFDAFERVVLPALVKAKELSEGSLCFMVWAETASALKELWNLYKDGTLRNRLQEFLVTKEVKEIAGSDAVEVTVFIDEHEWREAYVNMLFHQNQADSVKGEQVGERCRRNSDSFLFLKSKESNRRKMKLEHSENKWNFERQSELLQQENEKLQMLNKQTRKGDQVAPELSSQLEQELSLKVDLKRSRGVSVPAASLSFSQLRGKSYGQRRPPLTHILKSILERYPDGGQILKEIIQNADDAGATKVTFLLDSRPNFYGRSSLYRPDLAKFQGCALYAQNNALFKESDWENLQRLMQSSKKDDPLKVGRFGIGFNSVYHVTAHFYSWNLV